MPLLNRCLAEVIGTFWLVFAGCGSAVLAASFIATHGNTPINMGIGHLGVALTFGLTVMAMAFAIGHISGCHLNPAVTVGLCVAKRFPATEVVHYIVSQVIGAIIGAGVLYIIVSHQAGFNGLSPDKPGEFATTGFAHMSPSPQKFDMIAALTTEVVMTFIFVFVILGATDKRAPAGFAPIAIGLCLTSIILVAIPVTNLSVNPARSLGPAIRTMGEPLKQVWLFWVAPIAGATIAGVVYPFVAGNGEKK